MANTFYPKQGKASLQAFMGDFARFLVNDLGGFTGPGWTIIDTYSSGSASAHEVPGTATDMDSLAADNKWRTNLPATGDYIVLQASGGSTFQVGIEYESTSVIRFILAPLGGWQTAANNADMTTAGNWGSAKCTTVDMTVVAAAGNWSVVANTSRFILFCDQNPTYDFLYCGDLLDVHTGDTTNATISQYTGNVFFRGDHGSASVLHTLIKLSAVDNSTVISLFPCDFVTAGVYVMQTNYMQDTASGEYRIVPMYLSCQTASHVSLVGKLDGVYTTQKSLTAKGTINTKAYAFCSNNASYMPLVWDWDSTTAL